MPKPPSNVPDIRLVQNDVFPNYDVTVDWLLLPDGTLDDTQALATAVIIALGTNALASDDDILPDPDSTDRYGWWGDLDASPIWNGWPIGSKLWLLRRSKIVPASPGIPSTLSMVTSYIRIALQPFVDRKIKPAQARIKGIGRPPPSIRPILREELERKLAERIDARGKEAMKWP